MDYSQHLVRISRQIALDKKSHIENWESLSWWKSLTNGPVASWTRSPIWVPRNDSRMGCPGSRPREMDVAVLLDVVESRTRGAADDEKDGKLWNRAGISLCEMGRCLFSVFLTVIFCILISHVLSFLCAFSIKMFQVNGEVRGEKQIFTPERAACGPRL